MCLSLVSFIMGAMRSGVTVRLARAADWTTIAEIFKAAGAAAWPHIFSAESLEELSANERWREAIESIRVDSGVLVAELQNRVIGFVVFRPTGDSDALPATGEIDAFYTNPKIWGVGAGQALMDDALARLKQAGFSRVTLWTEERNHRPRRFYELWGWHTDGTTRTREVRGTEIKELRYWIGL